MALVWGQAAHSLPRRLPTFLRVPVFGAIRNASIARLRRDAFEPPFSIDITRKTSALVGKIALPAQSGRGGW